MYNLSKIKRLRKLFQFESYEEAVQLFVWWVGYLSSFVIRKTTSQSGKAYRRKKLKKCWICKVSLPKVDIYITTKKRPAKQGLCWLDMDWFTLSNINVIFSRIYFKWRVQLHSMSIRISSEPKKIYISWVRMAWRA